MTVIIQVNENAEGILERVIFYACSMINRGDWQLIARSTACEWTLETLLNET